MPASTRSQAIAGKEAHHLSAVRAFLKFAQRQGAIATSLLEDLVRARVTVTSFNRRLDLEEFRALVAAARRLGPDDEDAPRGRVSSHLPTGWRTAGETARSQRQPPGIS